MGRLDYMARTAKAQDFQTCLHSLTLPVMQQATTSTLHGIYNSSGLLKEKQGVRIEGRIELLGKQLVIDPLHSKLTQERQRGLYLGC
jgi:hypothetical protein